MKKKNIRYYITTAPSFKFYVVCIFTFTTSLLGASTFIRSFQSRPSTSAGRAHPYFTFADKFKRNKTFAGIKPKKKRTVETLHTSGDRLDRHYAGRKPCGRHFKFADKRLSRKLETATHSNLSILNSPISYPPP